MLEYLGRALPHGGLSLSRSDRGSEMSEQCEHQNRGQFTRFHAIIIRQRLA